MASLKFSWLTLKPREWAIRLTAVFSWPDASRDKCLEPQCGIERRHHAIHKDGHRFIEKAS